MPWIFSLWIVTGLAEIMFYQYSTVKHVLQILGVCFLSGCCSNSGCQLRTEYVFIICMWVCIYKCDTNDRSCYLQTRRRTCYIKTRTLFTGTFSLGRSFNVYLFIYIKSKAVCCIFFFCFLFWFCSDVPGQQINLVLMKSLDALEDCCFDTSLEYKWVSFITDDILFWDLLFLNST